MNENFRYMNIALPQDNEGRQENRQTNKRKEEEDSVLICDPRYHSYKRGQKGFPIGFTIHPIKSHNLLQRCRTLVIASAQERQVPYPFRIRYVLPSIYLAPAPLPSCCHPLAELLKFLVYDHEFS